MAKPISFQGVYPILATPFHDDESLDLDELRIALNLPSVCRERHVDRGLRRSHRGGTCRAEQRKDQGSNGMLTIKHVFS